MNLERMRNLAELRKLVKIKRESLDKISKFLQQKGVSKLVAEELSLKCLKEEEGMKALPRLLEETFPLEKSKTLSDVVMVGMTGCGGEEVAAASHLFCSPYDEEAIEEIGKEVAHLGHPELHLVLPCCLKEEDMYATLRQFSALPLTHLAFTHMEQTITLGTVLNVALRSELPTRYFSDSDGVYERDASPFVKHLLTHKNEKEFQLIRSIVMGERDGIT